MTEKAVTPPPLRGPTAKEKKYDRQLRLWAASGQQALEDAHILLLNSGSGVVGVETLKNLVLPGIGGFTIVDEHTVVEEDLGANFFLDENSLGKSRAAECCGYLRELNPEVEGHAVQKSPLDFDLNDMSHAPEVTLILLAAPAWYLDLSPYIVSSWAAGIPLVVVRSVGFYAQFTIQLPPKFPIVDTHPDPTSTQDLRLLAPWEELSQYARAQTKDLDSLPDHEHGHVPYLLLLLHHLDKWRDEHDGQYPQNYKEKDALRSAVRAGARTNNPEGGEENYDEAVGAVLKSLNPPSIPSGLKEVFAEPDCQAPQSTSANFWVIAHSIFSFVEANGVLPLPGAIPDMKAQSKDYVSLQNLYRAKAQSDLASVTRSVRTLELGLDREKTIDSKEIEAFCKGAAFVKLIHGRRSLKLLTKGDFGDRAGWAARELGDEESLLPIFIALMALDSAYDAAYNLKQPVTSAEDLLAKAATEDFAGHMARYISKILSRLQDAHAELEVENVQERIDKVVEEVRRSGPVELHNISSLTGGVVAQEIIKVITKQYVPVDNTCVIDGIQSRLAVYRL